MDPGTSSTHPAGKAKGDCTRVSSSVISSCGDESPECRVPAKVKVKVNVKLNLYSLWRVTV